MCDYGALWRAAFLDEQPSLSGRPRASSPLQTNDSPTPPDTSPFQSCRTWTAAAPADAGPPTACCPPDPQSARRAASITPARYTPRAISGTGQSPPHAPRTSMPRASTPRRSCRPRYARTGRTRTGCRRPGTCCTTPNRTRPKSTGWGWGCRRGRGPGTWRCAQGRRRC